MNRKRWIAILLSAACVAAAAPAARASEDNAGTTAANFLSVGAGPGIQGRGGATLGLWGDLTMVGWNPGALGWLRETEMSFAHATLLEEHTQDYMALGGRFGRSPVRWSLSGLYENEGTFESRDEFNNPTGSFGVSRFAGGGHVAFPLGPSAAFGIGGKWVSENLGDSRGAGVTFDMGLHVRSGAFGFGAAAQNAFGEMKFGGQSFAFPTNYGAGVGWSHRATGLRLAVDANFPNAYYTDVRAGVEWRWRHVLALRGGYRSELGAPDGEALTGPTFGMGAGAYGMWLDYAYIVPGIGEAQHRLGVSLRPGRMSAGTFGALAPSDDIWSDETAESDPGVEPDAKLPPREPKVEQPKAPKPAKVEKPRVEKPRVAKPVKTRKVEAPAETAPPPAVETAPPTTPPAQVAPPPVQQPKPEKPKRAPKTVAPKVEKTPAVAAPATPAPAASAPAVVKPKPAAPAEPAVRPAKITVKSGETLEMLAKRWGVSVPALMMDNDMVSTTVKPGQTLKLPAKGR